MSENLQDWEEKLLDKEEQPEFYDVLEVLSLKDNIDKVAKLGMVGTILVNFLNLYPFQWLLLGNIPTVTDLAGMIFPLFITTIETAIEVAIIYFSLKALAYILRILMEMEFNSRNAK